MTAAALAPAVPPRVLRNRIRGATGTARGTAPVRRLSCSSEDPDDFSRFMSKGERLHLLRTVRAWNEAHRGKGGRAPLTASTIHVLGKMLFELMDWRTGVLEHAYNWLAERSHRAYQTLGAAIAQLERAGILERQRRCRRGEAPDGPPWVQDINRYRFWLPAKVQAWWNERQAVRAARAKARMPEDAEHAQEAATAANAAAERDWAQHASDQLREARREADRARDVRGPGAAAYLARLDST